MRRVYSFLSVVLFVLMSLLTGCGGGSDYVGPTSPTPETGTNLSVGGLSSLSLAPVELKRFDITGGRKPYTAVSQNSAVVLASVSDATLSLAGVQSHAVPISVIITDALNNRISLAVTVSNTTGQGQFSLSPERVAVAPGNTSTVTVIGGSAPFTALAANDALVAVSTSGATVSITGLQETTEVLVRVIDSQGVSRVLPVAVAATSTNTANIALFSNLPTQPSLSPSTTRTYTIGGGTAPYSVTSSQPAVLTPNLRGSALSLQAGQVGTSLLTITDAAGASLRYTMTVQSTVSPLTLSTTGIFGTVGTKGTVQISGGRPPYGMFGDGAGVAAGSVNGNILSLELLGPGNGVITVYDADFNKVTMTAVATGTALSNKFGMSPAQVTISETLTVDASGAPQATVIPLKLTKAEPPISVFSSNPTLLLPKVNGTVVEVSTPVKDGKAIPPCVDGDTNVTITIIDSVGQSATSNIIIRNTGECKT
jgi:hypothetical protein